MKYTFQVSYVTRKYVFHLRILLIVISFEMLTHSNKYILMLHLKKTPKRFQYLFLRIQMLRIKNEFEIKGLLFNTTHPSPMHSAKLI